MAENFDALSAAVDRAVSMISEAVTIIQNPATDNNNQSVIDALTIRLSGAADALSGAVPATASVAAPAAADTVVADTSAPAADATASDTAPADTTSTDAPAA